MPSIVEKLQAIRENEEIDREKERAKRIKERSENPYAKSIDFQKYRRIKRLYEAKHSIYDAASTKIIQEIREKKIKEYEGIYPDFLGAYKRLDRN